MLVLFVSHSVSQFCVEKAASDGRSGVFRKISREPCRAGERCERGGVFKWAIPKSSEHRSIEILKAFQVFSNDGILEECLFLIAFEHMSCASHKSNLRPLGSANISSSVGSKSTCEFAWDWEGLLSEGQESKEALSRSMKEDNTLFQFLLLSKNCAKMPLLQATNACLMWLWAATLLLLLFCLWNMCKTGGTGLWFPLNSLFTILAVLACDIAIPGVVSLFPSRCCSCCSWVAMFLLQLHTTAHARNLHRVLRTLGTGWSGWCSKMLHHMAIIWAYLGYNKSPRSIEKSNNRPLNVTNCDNVTWVFPSKVQELRAPQNAHVDVLCKECRGLRRWHWRHYLRSANMRGGNRCRDFREISGRSKFHKIRLSWLSWLLWLSSFREMLQRPLIIPPSQCSCFDSFFCLATRSQVSQMGQNLFE